MEFVTVKQEPVDYTYGELRIPPPGQVRRNPDVWEGRDESSQDQDHNNVCHPTDAGQIVNDLSDTTSELTENMEKDANVAMEMEKPFACDVCGVHYKTRPGLQYHHTHFHGKEVGLPTPRMRPVTRAASHTDVSLQTECYEDGEPKMKHPKLTTLLFGSRPVVQPSHNPNSHLSKLLASKPTYTLQTVSQPSHQSPCLLQMLERSGQASNQSDHLFQRSDQPSNQSPYSFPRSDVTSDQSDHLFQKSDQPSNQSPYSFQRSDVACNQSDYLFQRSDEPSNQSDYLLQRNDQPSNQSPSSFQRSDVPSNQSDYLFQRSAEPSNQSDYLLQRNDQPSNQSPYSFQRSGVPSNQSDYLFQRSNELSNQSSSRLQDALHKNLNGMASFNNTNIKTEGEDSYQGYCSSTDQTVQKTSNHDNESVTRLNKSSSIMSLLRSGPGPARTVDLEKVRFQGNQEPVSVKSADYSRNVGSNSLKTFSHAYSHRRNTMEPVRCQNQPGTRETLEQFRNQGQIVMETEETSGRPRSVSMGTLGYHDNSRPIAMELTENIHSFESMEAKTIRDVLMQGYGTNTNQTVLQKSHKKLSDLLTGTLSSSASPLASSAASSAASSQYPKVDKKSLTPETSKDARILLQKLLTHGPSSYIRQDSPIKSEVGISDKPENNNATSIPTPNNTSTALLKLLSAPKPMDVMRSDLPTSKQIASPNNFDLTQQGTGKNTTVSSSLDATIEKLSSQLVQTVSALQHGKPSGMEFPSQSMGHSDKVNVKERPENATSPGNNFLKSLVKEKIQRDKEKCDRETLLLETLKQRLAEPRDELVVHLPLPGKDFLNLYKCDICGKAFPHAGTLKVHMRIHSLERQEFKCDVCGKVCSAKGYLLIHMRTHRKESNFTITNMTAEEFEVVEQPPALSEPCPKPVAENDEFQCMICGKSFNESENLLIHLRMHSGEKLYKCEVCGNGFTRKTQLGIHMRIHTGEKPYECHVCGKSFRQSNGLNLHMITHSEIKPYNCKHCQAGFSRKAQFEKHMRWHRGEKPYECGVCKKTFTDKFNLTVHFKIHQETKDHVCELCGKGYNQASHLKSHMQFHNGERGYSCDDCNAIFEHKRSLRNHIKTSHFDTYEKSLTSKTSLKRFQKMRANGEITENSGGKGRLLNDDSEDDSEDEEDSNSSDEDDTSRTEGEGYNREIKDEPEWYQDDGEGAEEESGEGAGQSVNQFEGNSDTPTANDYRWGHGNTGNYEEENKNKYVIKNETYSPYPGEGESDLHKVEGHSFECTGEDVPNLHKVGGQDNYSYAEVHDLQKVKAEVDVDPGYDGGYIRGEADTFQGQSSESRGQRSILSVDYEKHMNSASGSYDTDGGDEANVCVEGIDRNPANDVDTGELKSKESAKEYNFVMENVEGVYSHDEPSISKSEIRTDYSDSVLAPLQSSESSLYHGNSSAQIDTTPSGPRTDLKHNIN